MFTSRKRMSGWKVLRLMWTSYTVTPSHRYSPGGISLVTSCERTMVTSFSPSLSPRIMNPLPPLSSKKAALTVETPLSSRRSSSTRIVSPRENVSIALPSNHPPPPRTPLYALVSLPRVSLSGAVHPPTPHRPSAGVLRVLLAAAGYGRGQLPTAGDSPHWPRAQPLVSARNIRCSLARCFRFLLHLALLPTWRRPESQEVRQG